MDMVNLEVNENGYSVEWSGLPYDILYMVYCPAGPLKQIINSRIVIQEGMIENPYLVCNSRQGALKGRHLPLIPNGSYFVRICTNEKGEGEVLAEKKIYIGHKVAVSYSLYIQSDRDAFGRLVVLSDCYIDPDKIWVSYKTLYMKGRRIDTGIRVPLPKMGRRPDLFFYTECLIPRPGYAFAEIEIAEEIADCVQLVKR